jgi:two-component system, NtrC family, nitrogen regulation sensor histidine kinase NtrY
MRLRNRFILFAASIHGIMAIMAAFLLQYNILLFVISEVLIVVSVFISINLYRSFVMPLNIMAAGFESLKEKDFSLKFVKSGQFEIDQLIEVYNKMIDQLREERIEVNEQHFFLDKLIQASPSGILILDYENKIQSVNPSALVFLGMSSREILGKKPGDIPHIVTNQLEKLITGESAIIKGGGTKTYKCHKAHFINKGFHQHFIIMEELTAEILQAEKKAYEKVIRMMSHEINNTVGAVNSMLQSIKKTKFEEDDEHGQVLQVCIDRNRRMAKFMSNFADVVRLPEVRKKQQDLHVLLKDTAVLFFNSCQEKNIKLSLELDGEAFFISYDEQQMEQALINIIKNAVESIGKDGFISILTHQNPPQIIIRDTGKGIDESIKERLFSPFFSSKKEGQGIGLTLTKEILHKHNFNFSLETKPQGYTEFTVNFFRQILQ